MSRKAVKTSTAADVKSELPRNLLKTAVTKRNVADVKKVLGEHKELILDCVNELVKLSDEQIRDIVQWIVQNTKREINVDRAIFELAIRSRDIPTIQFIKEQGIEQYTIDDVDGTLKDAIDTRDFGFLLELDAIGYTLYMWKNLLEMIVYAAEDGCIRFIELANKDDRFREEYLSEILIAAAAKGKLNVIRYCYKKGADLFADNCAALRNAKMLEDGREVVQFLKSEMNQPYVIANMQRQQTQKNHEVIVDMLQHLTNYIEEMHGAANETSDTVADIKNELTSFKEAYDSVHQ